MKTVPRAVASGCGCGSVTGSLPLAVLFAYRVKSSREATDHSDIHQMPKQRKNVSSSSDAEKERTRRITKLLREAYPDARCSLNHSNPLELLVATVLSAQCTDERVNLVTADLFRKYRSCEDYLSVPQTELEQDIRSTGFFRNKAKAIQGACKLICEQYGGRVPETMEELLTLPGVARKTANVVLGNAFGIASGVVVDTHVTRVSERLGLSRQTSAEKIEQDLIALVPQKDWIHFPHLLIAHGRAVCKARTPLCAECVLSSDCPTYPLIMNAKR